MKIVKILAFSLVIVLLLIFVIQNVGQQITLKFFSESKIVTTEMIIVVLLSLILGVIIGVLISGMQLLTMKRTLNAVNTEYTKLKDEVDYLRNKDIENLEDNK